MGPSDDILQRRQESSSDVRGVDPDLSAEAGTVARVAARQASAVTSYRYQWALFADWCAAADTSPLPASPITLSQFLDENPAGDAAQLRRVSAINRAHRGAGHPAPGRVTSLRLALDSARAHRTIRRAAQYRAIAAALPTEGSTAALFGRRDAVLLLLAGTGMSYTAIAELDRGDISVDGGSIWIGGRHRIRIDPHEVTGFRPAEVWERWNTVLQFSDRYPSTALLAEHLQRNTFSDMTALSHRGGPVAVPIDRWGHLPLPAAPMTAAEIGSVIAAHRTGLSPLHTPRRRAGSTRVAGLSLGISRAALDAATRQSVDREQFGKPISANQAIAFSLADIATELRAGTALCVEAARALDNGTVDAETLCSMAKLYASENCVRHADKALQVFGGNGFIRGYEVERLYRDARITKIYEGTSEIQRLIISRSLLKGIGK